MIQQIQQIISNLILNAWISKMNICFFYLFILNICARTREVKNYSIPIWSRELALLKLFGTALEYGR